MADVLESHLQSVHDDHRQTGSWNTAPLRSAPKRPAHLFQRVERLLSGGQVGAQVARRRLSRRSPLRLALCRGARLGQSRLRLGELRQGGGRGNEEVETTQGEGDEQTQSKGDEQTQARKPEPVGSSIPPLPTCVGGSSNQALSATCRQPRHSPPQRCLPALWLSPAAAGPPAAPAPAAPPGPRQPPPRPLLT